MRAQIAAGLPRTPERENLAGALRAALAAGGQQKRDAAGALGIPRSTLDRWLELAGVELERGWREPESDENATQEGKEEKV